MEENEKTLTPREIGDLYWKKRKKVLKSAEELIRRHGSRLTVRGMLKEETLDTARAERILKRYQEEEKPKTLIVLIGKELSYRPPTASGDEIYDDSVLSVLFARDQYREQLEEAKQEPASDVNLVWIKNIEHILTLVDNVLKYWFQAAGIELETGKTVPPEKKKEAAGVLKKALEQYEITMRSYQKACALKAAIKLGWYKEEEPVQELLAVLESKREETGKEIEKAGRETWTGRLLQKTLDLYSDFLTEREKMQLVKLRWEEEKKNGEDPAGPDPYDALFEEESGEPLDSPEKIKAYADKLRQLREQYSEQFEGQTSSSVLAHPGVYRAASDMAFRIREAAVKAGMTEELVFSDAMLRVSCLAEEFIRLNEAAHGKIPENIVSAELYSMNYFVQQRAAIRAAKRFFEK